MSPLWGTYELRVLKGISYIVSLPDQARGAHPGYPLYRIGATHGLHLACLVHVVQKPLQHFMTSQSTMHFSCKEVRGRGENFQIGFGA